MKTIKEKVKVMLAASSGEAILIRGVESPKYKYAVSPTELEFDWIHYDYRIKPKPIIGYANVYKDGSTGVIYETADIAREFASKSCQRTAVKFKEILEGED